MVTLRVHNGYAGIGGNRHLWPPNWHVTATENDPRVAAEYARRYPHDEVIVCDSHEFVMTRAHEFDANWVSPPCPTHSRLAPSVAARLGQPLEPDPRLWLEIEHLRALGGRYVVENVHTYYEPPIPPDLVTERHYYWMNRTPLLIQPSYTANILSPRTSADTYAAAYGLPPLPRGAVSDPRKAMRNAVVPTEGLEVAMAAFSDAEVAHAR